jgi:two-component system response regulator LytT
MLKKTCLIVEDSEENKNLLLSFIEKTHFLNVVGTAKSYSEAMSFLLLHSVDLLFLDIEIPDSNGMNGLDILKTLAQPPATIITSSYEKFAVDSYSLGKTSDYLLKPYTFDRYLIAVNRALTTQTPGFPSLKEKTIFFKMGRRYQRFNLDEILYFEAYGIYLKVYTDISKKPMVINESLAGALNHLDKNIFIRVHKSFVINALKIDSFDANNILVNGFPIPLGASYKSKIDYLLKLFAIIDDE